MSEQGASKVIVREVEPALRGIPSAATAVAGMVGVAERGPLGVPVRVGSWEEYVQTFGGFVAGSDLPHAVLGFFQNGGQRLHVVRIAHATDVDDAGTLTAARAAAELVAAATAHPAEVIGTVPGPFALADGDVLIVDAGSGPITVGFGGTAAALRTGLLAPYLLADGMTLEVAVDGGAPQVATFRAADAAVITQATAAEVAAVLAAQVAGLVAHEAAGGVVLASGLRGQASAVTIVGGTALAALGLAPTTVAGTGTVARLDAVTVAEVAGLLAIAGAAMTATTATTGALVLRSTAVGPAATLQVDAATAAAFGLDAVRHDGATTPGAPVAQVVARDAGAFGNRLSVVVRSAGAGFDLIVREGGRVREVFEGLRADPLSARDAVAVVNAATTGSRLITLAWGAGAGGVAPGNQMTSLAQGDDGLAQLSDADFLGSAVAHTGLRALDAVADLALVAIPGRTSAVVAGALLAYAQDTRRGLVFAALDAPAGLTADDVVAYVAAAGLEGRTEHGALYWPRVRVPNPAIPVFGGATELVVPVAGHALGVLARTDAASAGGVYRAPAGVEVGRLVGVLGAEREQVHDEAARDLIYPHRINPVRGRYLDGARTLAGGGNFPTIGERRGASFIERSLLLGLDRLRHRANTPELRAEVYRTVFQFLLAQLNVGAFATRDPRTAFYVDVSEALNPPSVVFANELRLKIGIATAKPAEFIVIEVAQDTRALEAELANVEG